MITSDDYLAIFYCYLPFFTIAVVVEEDVYEKS